MEKYEIVWADYATDEMVRDYMDSYNDSQDEGDKITLEQAGTMIYEDTWYWENEWAGFVECITEQMGTQKYWRSDARDMGWMRRSGYKVFKAENGLELLRAISPDTDCSYRFTPYYKGFKVRIAHHDAPTGEYHVIKPVTEKVYEENA